jgi:hypothetical protein
LGDGNDSKRKLALPGNESVECFKHTQIAEIAILAAESCSISGMSYRPWSITAFERETFLPLLAGGF